MDLISYLPWRVYHNEKYVLDFQQAVDKELKSLQASRDDLYLQFRPATADWGMDIYEEEYALVVEKSKPLDQRLSMLRAKRQGRGTTTTPMIRKIASDLTKGDVDVVEFPEQDYFQVVFLDRDELPPNLKDLREILNEIIPAHLGYVFRLPRYWGDVLGLIIWDEYKDLLWGDIKDAEWGRILGKYTWEEACGIQRWSAYKDLTWGDLVNKTWGEVLATKTWGDIYNFGLEEQR